MTPKFSFVLFMIRASVKQVMDHRMKRLECTPRARIRPNQGAKDSNGQSAFIYDRRRSAIRY